MARIDRSTTDPNVQASPESRTDMTGGEIPHWRAWLIAIRPQTLPAGAAPVIIGTAFAVDAGVFAFGPAIAALLGALLIQIGTNLANDFFDAQRGVDTEDREGFTRVTQSGLLEPTAVKRGAGISFLAALVIGVYLVYVGGIPIVIIGLLSLVCGIAYAGGPFPFGSYALGDVFVFVFFGLVATMGTFYVQAVASVGEVFPLWIPSGTITTMAFLGGIAVGGLITAILVVNNIRDIETDRRAGKVSVAVLIGPRWSAVQYAGLLAIAYLVPIGLAGLRGEPFLALPILSAPYAVLLIRDVALGPRGATLNQTLESTGKLLMVYTILFAGGVVVQ